MDMTKRPESKPATAARIYDFYIGGTHNFPADRAAAAATMGQAPLIRPAAKANRAFLGRAVRFAAEAGVRQFLDIGSGIPTEGNVHEIAQDVDPACRVVYVDIDPVAVSEGLELLDGNEHATSIRGNVCDPRAILAHPAVARLIDPRQPVAIILCAVLHFVTDDQEARAAVATLRDACAPGSYLVLSHGTQQGDVSLDTRQRAELAEDIKVVHSVYAAQTSTPVRVRARAEIETFFDGYDLVDPGITWVGQWRADSADQPEFGGNSSLATILGGVGRLR